MFIVADLLSFEICGIVTQLFTCWVILFMLLSLSADLFQINIFKKVFQLALKDRIPGSLHGRGYLYEELMDGV